MRTHLRPIVLALAVAGSRVIAQEPLRFDAASIKPAPPLDALTTGAVPGGPGVFSTPSITLHQLVESAYDLLAFRVMGGPAWATTERFQVIAKTDASATRDERRAMRQQLLAERFGLRVHHETRELPVYNLVFARSDHRLGEGLTPAVVDCEPFLSGQRPMSESPRVERNGRSIERCATTLSWSLTTGVTTHPMMGITFEQLVTFLERSTGRRVIDHTGLTGIFDVTLSFVDLNMTSIPGQPRPSGEGPVLTTAVTEQLGLKLESAKAPVDVVIIDAAQKPTAD